MKKLTELVIYVFVLWQQPVNNSPSDTLSSGWQIPANPATIRQNYRNPVTFPWRSVEANSPTSRYPSNSRDVLYDVSFSTENKEKRQAENNSEFVWKATKTPQFVTSLLQKQKAEPIVHIYPPDVVYRNGRSRELVLPQKNDLKRIVYYTTLPDGPRHTPIANRRQNDFSTVPLSLPFNQQRSYDPTKAGKDFITRVQSSIIGIVPRGENKKDISSTPSFTIIDAHPTSYPYGMDRIMISDYHNAIGGVDKDRHLAPYSYSSLADPAPYQHHLSSIGLQHPNMIPYHGVNKNHVPQYQYHPQTYPQLYTEVEKIGPLAHHRNQHTAYQTASQYNVHSYPTRHNRFPPDRYPTSSSINFLDPPSHARPSGLDHSQYQNAIPHSVNNHGYEPPSPTSSLLPESGFELNDNFGPPIDHSSALNLDGQRPFRNKLSAYGDFFSDMGQKYLNLVGPTNDFSFKPQFSQVSDWLTNKPFDVSSFELDDFNSAAAAANAAAADSQDYHIKGSSSISGDSVQTNATSPHKEVNNTVITPFTSSFSNNSVDFDDN